MQFNFILNFTDSLITKYKIQNIKYKIQNTKYKIQNTKYKIQNTKYNSGGYGSSFVKTSKYAFTCITLQFNRTQNQILNAKFIQ